METRKEPIKRIFCLVDYDISGDDDFVSEIIPLYLPDFGTCINVSLYRYKDSFMFFTPDTECFYKNTWKLITSLLEVGHLGAFHNPYEDFDDEELSEYDLSQDNDYKDMVVPVFLEDILYAAKIYQKIFLAMNNLKEREFDFAEDMPKMRQKLRDYLAANSILVLQNYQDNADATNSDNTDDEDIEYPPMQRGASTKRTRAGYSVRRGIRGIVRQKLLIKLYDQDPVMYSPGSFFSYCTWNSDNSPQHEAANRRRWTDYEGV